MLFPARVPSSPTTRLPSKQFEIPKPHPDNTYSLRQSGKEAADRAAKETAENSLEEPEAETLKTLRVTTKSIICKTMKVE
jgi:hypothetical protein